MESHATESWVYTSGETELRRLADAFNINIAVLGQVTLPSILDVV